MTKVPVRAAAEVRGLAAFPEIEKLLYRIEKRAFELFSNRGCSLGRELDDWLTAEREMAFVPPAELTETETDFRIGVAVPGVPASRLQVDVLETCIAVEAAAAEQKEEKKGNTIFSDFSDRKLFRKFELPAKIDPGAVTANLENGMLHITAKKAATEAPKRIQVAAA